MRKFACQLVIILFFACNQCSAQVIDSMGASEAIQQLPNTYYSKVDKKINSVNAHLTKKSLKYLRKFQNQQKKITEKLVKLHSELLVNNVDSKYLELVKKFKTSTAGDSHQTISGEYNAYLDSLGSSLSFLKQFKVVNDKVNGPLTGFNQLETKLQESENIKAFIAERKNQIKEILSKYSNLPGGLKNEYAKLNKTAYYYSAQVKQYKEMLKDPDKIELKALRILREVPAFQKFMKENSQLGNLFGVPANYANSESPTGLQTLDQVQQLIKSRIGNGPNASQMLQQQVQAAEGQLNKFKDKLDKLGGGSGDMEMPDFKPNDQKTKPFLQRLEYSCNLQTTRGNYSFPTTSDLGLSIGYKRNNKSTIGIGASYKSGWGRDIQHIHITAEGMGLRSFFEYKLKKSFYASGGFEYNYQQIIYSLRQLENENGWQKSGLIGISKVVDVKSKIFKKTKLQLLWDFLSYSQPIRTDPVKFRVGYNF